MSSCLNYPANGAARSLPPATARLALHIAAAQPPNLVPMVEYLLRHQANKQFFFDPQYIPVSGRIALPSLPGLGIKLDESQIQVKHRLSF